MNILAYCELMMACEEGISFACVDDGRNQDLPDGDARLEWKNLSNRFEPKHVSSKVQLKREFSNCVLVNGEDPDVWFPNLENIRRKLAEGFQVKMDDDDMIIHIMYNLPSMYNDIAAVLEAQMVSVNEPLYYERLILQIRSEYGRMDNPTMKTQELAMTQKKFKGQCGSCGKIGHSSAKFYFKDKNKHLRTSHWEDRKCTWCASHGHFHRGHTEKYFRKKKKAESGDDMIRNQHGGVALCTHPPINKCGHQWIADSGESHHMTFDRSIMTNNSMVNELVTVGDGN